MVDGLHGKVRGLTGRHTQQDKGEGGRTIFGRPLMSQARGGTLEKRPPSDVWKGGQGREPRESECGAVGEVVVLACSCRCWAACSFPANSPDQHRHGSLSPPLACRRLLGPFLPRTLAPPGPVLSLNLSIHSSLNFRPRAPTSLRSLSHCQDLHTSLS